MLQSRALTLVLHHATAFANPASLPATLDILAPIPLHWIARALFGCASTPAAPLHSRWKPACRHL